MSDIQNLNKARLVSSVLSTRSVVFDASPDITETRNVNYKALDPQHMPGTIQVFTGTSARAYQLSGIRLVSRTPQEADKTMRILNILRGWTVPYFGDSSTINQMNAEERRQFELSGGATAEHLNQRDFRWHYGREMLGAPPEVLYFSAYSNSQIGATNRNRPSNIHRIPVVINMLTISYPTDVDYIHTTYGVPVPIIRTVDIGLTETHSAREYERFNIHQYRTGRLPNF